MIASRPVAPAVAAGVLALLTAATTLVAAGAAVPLTYKVVAGRATSGSVTVSGKTGTATPAVSFTDTATATAIDCTSGTIRGTVPLGRTRTARLGTITATAAKNCSAFDGLAGLAYQQKSTWRLSGASKTSNGATNVSIGGVHAVFSSSACTFMLSGVADGVYRNATKKLVVSPRTGSGHALHASNVGGCGGVITNGDTMTWVTTFAVSTPKGALKIT